MRCEIPILKKYIIKKFQYKTNSINKMAFNKNSKQNFNAIIEKFIRVMRCESKNHLSSTINSH